MSPRLRSKKSLPAVIALVVVLFACVGIFSPSHDHEPSVADMPAAVQSIQSDSAGADASESTQAGQEPAVEEGGGAPLAGSSTTEEYSLAGRLPVYDGSAAYVRIDDGVPAFTDADLASNASWESYSPLDALGRVGVAEACLGRETMPTEEREDISEVTPSGWEQGKYDFVDGGWLYNRSHLIGFQLAAENANERNLMTGTRSMNLTMLDFESRVADYIKTTGNHVLYRVTPYFDGGNLVASGVQMEAMSVEDRGQGISLNVYAFNVEPGVGIDYATGSNWADGSVASDTPVQAPAAPAQAEKYVLNENSKVIHHPDCPSVGKMSPKNRRDVEAPLADLLASGYKTCGNCF